MKTIGVLGGLGPQATMDFEARLHRAAQQVLPPMKNGGYPPVVVWFHRRPPVLLDETFKPRLPITPDPALIEGARRLGPLCDFIVIPSNGPHLVQKEIEAAAGRPVLSLIELTLAEVSRRGWTHVGVCGLGNPMVYTGPLGAKGLRHEIPPGPLQEPLDAGIFRVMEGRETDADRAAARAVIEDLRGRGVQGTIVGCTEIPLLLGTHVEAPDLVNPAQLLAVAAVRRAIEPA